MTIIDDLIFLLEKNTKEISIPKIKRITIGMLFILIELENGISGLAFNKIEKDFHKHVKDAGNLTSRSIFDLVEKARFDEDVEKSIGIAAINAISQLILTQNNYSLKTDLDIVDFMEFKSTETCGMIGNIAPLVQRIVQKVKKLTVIEDNPKRWDVPAGVKIFKHHEDLKNINKLIITGSAILYKSFDSIIKNNSSLEKVAIVGPTMGTLPEPFFQRGIHAIGGMKILNPEKVHQIIMQAGGTPQFSKYCEKYLIINSHSKNYSPST
ncbi:MAG: hypothetical protein EAX96_16715 [Candidatus Lokiarchaeota archaeon]|nr:hypothetical protein [Candidatus Lokiarchaeota archaeon]